ncbi:alpha/beta fold hydrolase [Actinomadura physcomitrii]|nr:alpha/beta fold hydrolase [Actinomadura physcomitrii]
MVLAVVAGVAGLVTADRGIERRSAVVSGVPVEVVRPDGAEGRLPGVVVAPGLSASMQLMRGFADTLARRGYVVELVDLAGGGASRERLPDLGEGPEAEARLDADVDVAVRHLRTVPGVDGSRIGLVGHSMGAAAAVRYAGAHPDVAATVAISQGTMPFGKARPRDLLLVAGGLEFAGYRDGAVAGVRAAYPQGRAGVTYGDPRAGTARRAVIVGGAEHVGVLFQPRTHREVAAWFDGAFGRPGGASGAGIRPFQRAGSAMLLHLAAVLSFAAVASVLLGRPGGEGGGRTKVPLALALGAPVVAVLAAVGVVGLIPRMVLAVGIAGPLAGFFAVAGLLCAAVSLRKGGDGGRPWWRTVVSAVALVVLTVVSFAVPAQLGWAHAVPVGPRVWALVPVAVCAMVFFAGIELLCGGYSARAAVLIHAWTAAGALAGLGLAAVLGLVSWLVLLAAPLLAGLLVWQGVQAAALRALRAPVWVTALVGGALLAWPIAVTMPIG